MEGKREGERVGGGGEEGERRRGAYGKGRIGR